MPKTQAPSRGGKPAPRAPAQARAPAPRPQDRARPQGRTGGGGAVVVQDDGAQLPAHLQKYVGQGMQGIENEDLARPRLKLMQALSPELQEYNDARAGDFLHTSAGMILSGEGLKVVPIFVAKRFLLWRPRDDGGGILARSDDGVTWSPPGVSFEVRLDKKDGGGMVTWVTAETVKESGLDAWGTMNPTDPNSPPAATKMYDYVLGFPDYPELEPAVFSFQRSSWTVGRNWNTKLKTAISRTPIFQLVYGMSSVDDRNASNQDFKNLQVTALGKLANNDPLLESYAQVHESLLETGVVIRDEASLQTEDDARNEAPAAQPQQQGRRRF